MTILEDLYKLIPTNARLYGESLLGSTSPITEKDFTPSELAVMREMYQKQKQANDAKMQQYKEGIPQIKDEKLREQLLQKLKTYEDTKNKTSISYDEYPENRSVVDTTGLAGLYKSFTDPYYTVSTSLGRYNVMETPTGPQVVDNYNWDNELKMIESLPKEKLNEMSLQSIENALAKIAAHLKPSTNRPVNIKLEK